MKLDTWQARVAVEALRDAVEGLREFLRVNGRGGYTGGSAENELNALEAMAAALESGESLEVGP